MRGGPAFTNKRATTPELLITLIELAQQKPREFVGSHASPSIRSRKALKICNNSLGFKSATGLPRLPSCQILVKVERMIAETRSLVDGLRAQQSMIVIWIQMTLTAMEQVRSGRLVRKVRLAPSAAEATLIVDDFIHEETLAIEEESFMIREELNQGESNPLSAQENAPQEPADDVAEAHDMFDNFVLGGGMAVQPQSTSSLHQAATKPKPQVTQEANQNDSHQAKPLIPSSSRLVSFSHSKAQIRTGTSQGVAPSADRGILKSRGWSRMVASIAHSPGGIPDGSTSREGLQGGSLEMPRTPEDFDRLLKDAGLNLD